MLFLGDVPVPWRHRLAPGDLRGRAGDRAQRRFSVRWRCSCCFSRWGAYAAVSRALRLGAGFNRFRGYRSSRPGLGVSHPARRIGLDLVVRTAKTDRRLAIVPLGLAAVLGIAAAWGPATAAQGEPAPALAASCARSATPVSAAWREPTAKATCRSQPTRTRPSCAGAGARFDVVGSGGGPCAIADLDCSCCGVPESWRFSWPGGNRRDALLCVSVETHFHLSTCHPLYLKTFLDAHAGERDVRFLNRADPNAGMSFGTYDIWGYAPAAAGRYAEFMYFSQGKNRTPPLRT